MWSDAHASAKTHRGDWFEGWTLLPRDASGDLTLTPLASKACWHLTCLCLAAATGVHLTFGYSETSRCARHTSDPTMPQYFMLVANLATAGLFFEVAWAAAIRYMGLDKLYRSEIAFRKRLRLNVKMLCLFFLVAVFYYLMAFDVHVVHTSWLAQHYGGSQLVYSLRYTEWVFCAPLVLSVLGQLEHTAEGHARNALIPSSLLSSVYCIISWQALVVKSVPCSWCLIALIFLCYFVAAAEQLSFAWYIKDKGKAGSIRAGLIFFTVAVLGVYGAAYLMPVAGWITSTLSNKVFCLGDAVFKLSACALVMVTEDVYATVEMWRRAAIFAEDQTALIDKASVPIFTVDCEGTVTHFNERAGEVLPLAREEILGTPLLEMVPDANREKCKKMLQSALSMGPRAEPEEESTILETSFHMPGQTSERDEHAPILRLSASARRCKVGSVASVTIVGHDVTAYKQADERKARFMATMSHELRSPLHGIIGLSEHLAIEEDDSTKASSLQMITKCSKRLLGLVVDIMDMASLSVKHGSAHSKQMVLHKDPVELSKIIEEVLALVKSSSDKFGKPLVKRGVRLVNELAHLPVIQADAAKCTQIFFNLVTNACKFTQSGSITAASERDPDGEWVEVSITDTGSGISPQNLHRIFKPFEQEDNSMARGHDGLGLGLAIANEVARMHGGSIRVASKLGVGTTFTVRLPVVAQDEKPQDIESAGDPSPEQGRDRQQDEVAAEDPPETKGRAEPDAAAAKGAVPLPPARRSGKPLLLSVDDDHVNQLIVEKQLGDGFEIVKAFDGEEACDFFRESPPPDLVLLDYMMPGMHGMEVLKFIRQDLKLDSVDVPVIMISAADHAGTVAEAMDLGCNDYVYKPFEASHLKERMEVALSAKRQLVKEMAGDGNGQAPKTQPPHIRLPAAEGRPCFLGLWCLRPSGGGHS